MFIKILNCLRFRKRIIKGELLDGLKHNHQTYGLKGFISKRIKRYGFYQQQRADKISTEKSSKAVISWLSMMASLIAERGESFLLNGQDQENFRRFYAHKAARQYFEPKVFGLNSFAFVLQADELLY